jgi:hypothetical protein
MIQVHIRALSLHQVGDTDAASSGVGRRAGDLTRRNGLRFRIRCQFGLCVLQTYWKPNEPLRLMVYPTGYKLDCISRIRARIFNSCHSTSKRSGSICIRLGSVMMRLVPVKIRLGTPTIFFLSRTSRSGSLTIRSGCFEKCWGREPKHFSKQPERLGIPTETHLKKTQTRLKKT